MMTDTKICTGCKSTIIRRAAERPSHFHKRMHCSQQCYHSHTNHNRNYNDLTNQEVEGLIFIKPDGFVEKSGQVKWMIQCYRGNLFTTRPQRIFSRVTTSCGCYRSKVCSERAKLKVGPLHPNWNSELTEEDRLRDRPQAARSWSLSVYKKDGYKCILCGSNKILNAHHLDGWNWCKEKRYDLENGVTLCEKCHISFHSQYGRGDNTHEQFQEFLEGQLV